MKWTFLCRAIDLAKGTDFGGTRRPQSSFDAAFEALEPRIALSAPGSAIYAEPMMFAEPAATIGAPTANTPAKIRHAYGFDQIYFSSGTVQGDGTGQTIAIVSAYDHPTIESDLSYFSSAYGLPQADFTKKKMSTTMTVSPVWALESAMDVQWAHAIAPGAKILLVEAKSASFKDLFAAVDYANAQPGVSSISMSWGTSEFAGETIYDSRFITPAGHIGGGNQLGGITYVASAGDVGARTQYPAVSPNVLSVGGTRLSIDSAGNYLGETAWSKSGGGVSLYESKPAYQSLVTASSTKRVGPDVAYNGDPLSGFPVYTTSPYYGIKGWFQVAGTSAGAPQWAALAAIANQGRAINGQPSLYGSTQTQQSIYSMSPTNFHDVITGSNGYSASTGFDLVTGRGSPYANRVVSSLVSTAAASSTAKVSTTAIVPITTQSTFNTKTTPSSTLTTTEKVSEFDWFEWAKRHKKGSFATIAIAEAAAKHITVPAGPPLALSVVQMRQL